ncbi:nucleoside hydrolase [Sphingomonas sp.]|uniref:nucleoside hydrolase n=1 Tax=Sphingomonas sp. TaxID=28214 RepID=UPI000DB42F23|nr:nucleoside hydrolase [Sphingomonas sp.]PZU09559.1 MAG: nucleoside hydrolase [Sphingomonas sp.]
MKRWILACAALLLAFMTGVAGAGAAAPGAERRKIIIDQDAFEGPGLQPILMLLNDPSVEVLGITIVSGDGWQPEETAATLRMLELVKRTDIPVVAGATFPLVNSKERNKRREALYGALPYKGAWMESWPAYNTIARREPHAPDVIAPMAEGMPTTRPAPISAAEFLLAMSRKYPGQVTIIAMGPLTNLALAQRIDDGFAGRIRELVTEGGNFVGRDLTKAQDEFAMQVAFNPRMSFNHFWDPEAAHIVFTSPWPKLTLVTGDASDPAIGTAALLARATASDRPTAAYVKRIAQPNYPLWDEVQAAVWLDPKIVTARGRLAMDVDLMPGANYGALLTWPAGKGPGLGERDVDLVYAVDVPRVEAMFVDLIGR